MRTRVNLAREPRIELCRHGGKVGRFLLQLHVHPPRERHDGTADLGEFADRLVDLYHDRVDGIQNVLHLGGIASGQRRGTRTRAVVFVHLFHHLGQERRHVLVGAHGQALCEVHRRDRLERRNQLTGHARGLQGNALKLELTVVALLLRLRGRLQSCGGRRLLRLARTVLGAQLEEGDDGDVVVLRPRLRLLVYRRGCGRVRFRTKLEERAVRGRKPHQGRVGKGIVEEVRSRLEHVLHRL